MGFGNLGRDWNTKIVCDEVNGRRVDRLYLKATGELLFEGDPETCWDIRMDVEDSIERGYQLNINF